MKILNRPVFQYAYDVNDIDQAAMQWMHLFGAGPFARAPHHTVAVDRRGYFRYRRGTTDSDFSYAFAY